MKLDDKFYYEIVSEEMREARLKLSRWEEKWRALPEVSKSDIELTSDDEDQTETAQRRCLRRNENHEFNLIMFHWERLCRNRTPRHKCDWTWPLTWSNYHHTVCMYCVCEK